jgi:hypothetical protein
MHSSYDTPARLERLCIFNGIQNPDADAARQARRSSRYRAYMRLALPRRVTGRMLLHEDGIVSSLDMSIVQRILQQPGYTGHRAAAQRSPGASRERAPQTAILNPPRPTVQQRKQQAFSNDPESSGSRFKKSFSFRGMASMVGFIGPPNAWLRDGIAPRLQSPCFCAASSRRALPASQTSAILGYLKLPDGSIVLEWKS